ncbi:MAG: penicillin-binding protein 1B [Pontibacterium sp.]
MFRGLVRFLLKASVVVLVLAALGLVYLDAKVLSAFEGQKWALPAKVFARPLEVYEGKALTREQFKAELQGLGYQAVSRATHPGTMEVASSRIRVYTRGFEFADGTEPAQRVLVSFSNNEVISLRDDQNQAVSLLRMEPLLIGGIYPTKNEDREIVSLAQVPSHLSDALITVEDRYFYDHYGVSLRGIARAFVANLQAGRVTQGGSTLTQQLVKNYFLTSERSIARKLLEIPMAMLLELHYSKDEILEAYLNEVYLGQSGARAIHGFGLASQYYFAKPVSELALHEAALLAGMVKGPSAYDPRRHPERAKTRRDLVLRLMADAEVISPAQMKIAQSRGLGVVKQRSLRKGAHPAYLDLVKRQLSQDYEASQLRSEGLRIFTALDPTVQARAEASLVTTINQLEKRHGKKVAGLQGAMVVTDPQTAEVLAVVGGRNTRYRGFNRALDANRSIGSLIKPAVYLAALEQGYSLASVVDDSPISVRLEDGSTWVPKNFDGQSHGEVPLYLALARSYNLSSARLGMDIGLNRVLDMLDRLGIDRDVKPYPSLLLGAESMSPVEVAQMYQTLAANGFNMPVRAIRSVTNAQGQELSRYTLEIEPVVSAANAFVLQYGMQAVMREGTGRRAYQVLPEGVQLAGKTGTTNDQRDSWFAGYGANRLAVVWLGTDDNRTLPFTGSSGALPAWIEFMRQEKPQSLRNLSPDGISYAWVDETTGLLSHESCEGARFMPFVSGTEPTQEVDCGQHRGVKGAFQWFKRWLSQGQ